MTESRKEQLEKNYAAFTRELPGLIAMQGGKFALMRDGKIIEFFETPTDALVAGSMKFSDGLFSIQEVVDAAVNLGFFSSALP